MKFFEIKRNVDLILTKDVEKFYNEKGWIEYINISKIEEIIGHLSKNEIGMIYQNGYDVYLSNGHFIWITEDESIKLRKMINEYEE